MFGIKFISSHPARRKFFFEIGILAVLISSPFLFYAYLLAPSDSKVLDLRFFEYIVVAYPSAEILLWVISIKVLPIVYLSVWYVSCYRSWRYAIWVPLSMYVYQLSSHIVNEFFDMEISQYWANVPLALFILGMLYLTFKSIRRFVIRENIYHNLENEINELISLLISSKEAYKANTSGFKELIANRTEYSSKEYLYRLISFKKSFLATENADPSEGYGAHIKSDERFDRLNIATILILVSTPLIFYIYLLVPEGVSTWSFWIFTISTDRFVDVNMLIWFSLNKFVPMVLLSLWFVTARNWWKPAILIPLTITVFQFASAINEEARFADEYEVLQSLPITLPIILFLVWLARKLNRYSLTKKLTSILDMEIEHTLNELVNMKGKLVMVVKNDLDALRRFKKTYSDDEYLYQMVLLRNRLNPD